MPARQLAVAYLAVQSAVVAGWWISLWVAPSLRAPFVMAADWPETTLFAFALPDVVAVVAGSALAAHGLHARRAWGRPLLLLVAGGVFYATLWCLGVNLVTGSGWLSTVLMSASSLGTGFALVATAR